MDCKTVLFILGAIGLFYLYKLTDKYFGWLMAGGIFLVRGAFVVIIVIALLGTPGFPDELVLGAAWAALEIFVGQIQKRKRQATDDFREYDEEEDEVVDAD